MKKIILYCLLSCCLFSCKKSDDGITTTIWLSVSSESRINYYYWVDQTSKQSKRIDNPINTLVDKRWIVKDSIASHKGNSISLYVGSGKNPYLSINATIEGQSYNTGTYQPSSGEYLFSHIIY